MTVDLRHLLDKSEAERPSDQAKLTLLLEHKPSVMAETVQIGKGENLLWKKIFKR